ncbi:MAG: serine/threonine protein kinase [Saprospiraceae bacterium]|jgi:serine/threonine protein kinase
MNEPLLSSNRYQELDQLGEGATADVRRVFDTHLNRLVARKNFDISLSSDARLLQTFLNEAKLVSYLAHPGIVPVYDLSADESRLSYTMPIADGDSLSKVLESDAITGNGRALPIDQAVSILIKLCETLSFSHDKGVLHLDIKPDNIIIGHYGEVYILDWGAARLINPEQYAESIRALSAQQYSVKYSSEESELFLGTPKYMSPEQTTVPRDQLTGTSDIFSLGIIAYQMLCGQHPFQANSIEQLFDAIQNQAVIPLGQLNSTLPAKLIEIVERMLQKSPIGRYESFTAVLQDLNSLYTAGGAMETRDLAQGEVIFSQGDSAGFAFTILRGEVEISIVVDGKRKLMSTLGEGEMVGELAAISNQVRTATVTTTRPTRIAILSVEFINTELEKTSPWVGSLIRNLANRFSDVNADLAAYKPES